MTMERKQAQIRWGSRAGLLFLAAAFLAGAMRSTALDRAWVSEHSAASGILLAVWILGMVASGISLGWTWLIGRRLDPAERRILGDEYQVLLSRNAVVTAFQATFIAAVAFVAVPGSSQLPGDAVASVIAGVGVGTLAVRHLRDST